MNDQQPASGLDIKLVTLSSGKQTMAMVSPSIDISIDTPDDDPVSEQVLKMSAEDVPALAEKISTHDIAFDTLREEITITPKVTEDMPDEASQPSTKKEVTSGGRTAE